MIKGNFILRSSLVHVYIIQRGLVIYVLIFSTKMFTPKTNSSSLHYYYKGAKYLKVENCSWKAWPQRNSWQIKSIFIHQQQSLPDAPAPLYYVKVDCVLSTYNCMADWVSSSWFANVINFVSWFSFLTARSLSPSILESNLSGGFTLHVCALNKICSTFWSRREII